jgi:hypothetical protein
MEKQPKVSKYLSASRIKLLETCSWLYWARYHLGIPDKSNSGAKRGTICHLVFELLLNKRHKRHFDVMMKRGGVESVPALVRLIKKHLRKEEIDNEENYEMIKDMIWVGINNDFFGEGGKVGNPETEFEIVNENPKYRIKGFIDKYVSYNKGNSIKIVDYKSSKSKFKGEELLSNTQGMMYTLAGRTLWPKAKDISVDFLFLRFPKQPKQSLSFSQDQINGFELYLEYLNKRVDEFDEDKATLNYAFDTDKNKWLCEAGKTWVCPLKKPFDYYVVKDKDGKVIKSSLENNLEVKEGEISEVAKYKGCPRFSNFTETKSPESDPFDF